MKTLVLTALLLTLSGPAFAGDAALGEADFKKCKSCHAVTGADGTEIVKGGKVGPNLFGVVGRAPGTVAEYKYGPAIIAAGATGFVWDEENLATYLVDPSAWLKTITGDPDAKSKMTFKLTKGAEDMAAYLVTLHEALAAP